MNNVTLTPPLKWAGGKRWLVPQLKKLWLGHETRRLVEPFCGGLAVALGLQPEKALLNDINPHLINFYRWLQRGIQSWLIPEDYDKERYYGYRRRFNELIRLGQADTEEAAVLFYYLNRSGYNGLCRFNKKGYYNVPFGRYKQVNYLSTEDFEAYPSLMKNWIFSCGDFDILTLEQDDFIYADPPYDVEFTQYSAGGFTWEDQQRLAEWLTDHPGPVVLSNQATPRIVDLYLALGYELRFLDAPRRISCNGDRTPAKEVLALRNIEHIEVPSAPAQLDLF
ncbi:MAG: Dam family site-specific DNA-(adenine-N6)-methyltransferase [Chloroflexi bacterium]|nr:MAG: Dam family site-specific DNA-(adenine-N6)-methyltransferase [Chloroflexota bacterium]